MKKIITLVLILSFVFGTTVFAEKFSDFDVNDFIALRAYDILSGYEDGTFKPDNKITRAEFAKWAVLSYEAGYDLEVQLADEEFSDVDSTHWAHDYISKAVSIGAISGYDDGTFRPDDNVTYEQAVTIAFSTIGYKPVLDMYGGYPYAYIAFAYKNGWFYNSSQTKHMKNTVEMNEAKTKEYITRRDAACIINYMFLVPICDVIGYEDDMYGKIPVYTIGGEDEIEKTLWSMQKVKLLY